MESLCFAHNNFLVRNDDMIIVNYLRSSKRSVLCVCVFVSMIHEVVPEVRLLIASLHGTCLSA
jgi:hypothetical protein